MSFREQADKTIQALTEALGSTPTPEQVKAATNIIERAIVDSFRDGAVRSAEVAKECCAEDQDLAHKIANEIQRTNTALITNLSSMR